VVATAMFGFTMNHLYSKHICVSDHVTSMATLRHQSYFLNVLQSSLAWEEKSLVLRHTIRV